MNKSAFNALMNLVDLQGQVVQKLEEISRHLNRIANNQENVKLRVTYNEADNIPQSFDLFSTRMYD